MKVIDPPLLKKAIEYFEWDLLGYPGRNMEDSAEDCVLWGLSLRGFRRKILLVSILDHL